jgi:hypothetical protein
MLKDEIEKINKLKKNIKKNPKLPGLTLTNSQTGITYKLRKGYIYKKKNLKNEDQNWIKNEIKCRWNLFLK